MQNIKQFFHAIDKDDIDENSKNLISDGLIDSVDVMALVGEIEKSIQKPIDTEFMVAENFEDFESIKNLIDRIISEK